MQFIFNSIILSLCICLFAPLLPSCGKIELTDDQTEKPDDEGGDDHNQPPTDNPDDYALNVCQLPDVADGTEVYVAGYIVGFVPVPGSIKNMVFGTTDAEASNLVIADYPDETDPKRCAAVQLTKCTAAREEQNLHDHHENLGRAIYVGGITQKYFAAPGVKNVKEFGFINDDDPTQPDKPAEPDKPVQPVKTFPILKTESPAAPFEGC